MEQVIAHVDMDCFFCACEIKRDPTLKGKPVMVGSTSNRGVISASSYEARKFGVFSATPISKARELCPDGIFIGVDMRYYVKESTKIMQVFSDIADDIEPVSIDEAYLDVTEYSKKFNSLEDMGEEIRNQVLDKTGLSCSVGISSSRIVSKIASDYNKPAGVTIVKEPRTFLAPLKITKIPGIGKVTKKYYLESNINTVGDLALIERFEVLSKFGESGIYFQNIALGLNTEGLVERGLRKSIGGERTFAYDTADKVTILRQLYYLCEYVHEDLDWRSFKTITLKLRYSDFQTITRAFTLSNHTISLSLLKETVKNLFIEKYKVFPKIRLIGVKISNFSSDSFLQTTLGEYFSETIKNTCYV